MLTTLTNHPGLRIAATTLSTFLTIHIFWKYFYSLDYTSGISMVPTIPHGHDTFLPPVLLTSKFYSRGRNIAVGDVITFVHPMQPQNRGCKRVVGMPGDWICVQTPSREDEEEENKEEAEGTGGVVRDEMFQVPAGHCWVVGDNVEWSRDSRLFGPLPLALVRGKVLAVVWPRWSWKWFRNGENGGLVESREDKEKDWLVLGSRGAIETVPSEPGS
jgi:inner membrane protease subunit 1